MKITEQATMELKKAIENFGYEGAGVRIFKSQGCCGSSLQMDLAKTINSNQIVLNINNIDLFVDRDLVDNLSNVTIDFGKNGFVLLGFQNSKGTGCCG